MLRNLFRSRDTCERAAPAPIETRPAEAQSDSGEKRLADASLSWLLSLLEADLRRSAEAVSAVGADVSAKVGNSVKAVEGIRMDTAHLADQTGLATENTERLTSAVAGLLASSEGIGRRAEASTRLAADASSIANGASRSIDDLKVATEQIKLVVKLISDVAGQTNLLALNATIEAARAGDAGRGFAVVANEVKALSVETRKATNEISSTIMRLQETAETSFAAVGRIIDIIGEMRPGLLLVADAVQEQIETANLVGRTANEGAQFARDVAGRAKSILAATDSAVEAGGVVQISSGAMNRSVQEMTLRLVSVLRQIPQGDRRRYDRWPHSVDGTFSVSGKPVSVRTLDISLGGVLLTALGEAGLAADAFGVLDLAGIGPIRAQVVATSRLGHHVRFTETDGPAVEAVRVLVTAIADEYRPAVERAQHGANQISAAMEASLQRGDLTLAELFDTEYERVPGSDPAQYDNRAVPVLQRFLPSILDDVLARDRQMSAAFATDVNGFAPAHNSKCSLPQRPGDPKWNAVHSRNKRIFDDRAGILAARNARPFLVQVYPRDMGGGQTVMMKDVLAPIQVAGRHWGTLRTIFQL